jgi:hypothetical protein
MNRLGPATDELPPEVDAVDITKEEGDVQQVGMFDHPRGQDSSRDAGETPEKLRCLSGDRIHANDYNTTSEPALEGGRSTKSR